MSLTGNYEAAFELSEQVVKEIFEAAHASGEIPHEITATETIHGYPIEAIVNILQTGVAGALGLSFDTPVNNGIKMTLPLDIQVNVQNSPAPSINPIEFAAGLEVTAPVQGLPDAAGNKELVLNLAGLPDNQVVVTMPAAEVVQVTEDLIEDGLHKAYDDGVILHSVTYPVPILGNVTVDVVDDDADPSRQIQFTLDNVDHGTITLPVFIHILGGLEDNVVIHDVRLQRAGDILTIQFGHVDDSDVETTVIPAQYRTVIAMMVRSYADYEVFVPGNDTIAEIIRDQAKQELDTWGAEDNGRIHLYTPNAVENTPVDIVDFDVIVKPGFLGVLFNPMDGANPSDVDNFIPAGKKFAQALAEPVVQRLIDQALQEQVLDENGCAGWPCKFDHEIEGHEVTLTSKPNFTLKDGHIKMTGSAEVEVDCWFDPDVSFEAKVNFSFQYNADGDKIIVPNVYDEDVDLDCLDWFLGFIIPIYGWIALIVVVVVVNSVGGDVVGAEGDKIVQGTEYIAGEIHGVGGVTTELDQIDVDPEGIILSGGTFVTEATFPLTIAPSDSGAPYVGLATALITLQSPYPHPKGQYHWDFADGHMADGLMVQHSYLDDGIYITKLTTNVDDPSGVQTHHFARVKVLNVQPDVDAGADIVAREGEVINFVGHFTDDEWVDTHVARWSWGDESMDVGDVVETHDAPRAVGVVTGEHAYCDNGEYTVTLRVIDDDGGVGKDTLKVRVENVPPVVDAGEDMFAYPCTPITLVARITDPGWCDTHIGSWDFGDCTPPLPATIRETHEPPAGTGIAAATHVYDRCGTYLAACTVVDDDGGVGDDTLAVRVIDVKNRDFEGGFRNRRVGTVANDWEPYVPGMATGPSLAALAEPVPPAELFQAEEFVVHGGQRSQRIGARFGFRGGLYQQVGANRGWDYQVSAWYHLDERLGGICRLGVDPTGGTDPDAPAVLWSQGQEHRNWTPLLVRVTAEARAITIFLEARAQEGAAAFFDDVALVPYPCPLKEPEAPEPEPEPPPARELCVDWATERESRDLGRVYQKNGFTFQSFSQDPLRIVLWGDPQGQGKLALPAKGLRVLLPFVAGRAVAHVAVYTGEPVQMRALRATGDELAKDSTVQAPGPIQTLAVDGEGIKVLEITGGGNEALLIDLCIYQEAEAGPKRAKR
jgi:hypothetical protein